MPESRVTIGEITIGDPPESWEAAGFSVDGSGVCQVGDVTCRLVGPEGGRGIRSWSLCGIGGGSHGPDIDGLPGAAPGPPAPRAPRTHANGCIGIDHVVVGTPDMDRTVSAFAQVGLEPRRIREATTYGAPMLQTFLRAGTVIVEVIGPAEASGDGPATFYGIAYAVEDLDATARLLEPHIGRIKDAVQSGRRIATLRHREVGVSVPTAFMSPDHR